MSPAQHLAWFDDNIDWFLELPETSLSVAVPACPGWDVEKVVGHLAMGLGLAYPYGMRAKPNCADADAFAHVPWPNAMPAGPALLQHFEETMKGCLATFAATDPTTACYTYEGPGVAGFWFRRAAIETTLHRMDVAEALNLNDQDMPADRANDAVAEAIEFALPLAATWAPATIPAVVVRTASGTHSYQLGQGPPVAEITGQGSSLLAALWGRSRDGVEVHGDERAASDWMSLVEKAFAGR